MLKYFLFFINKVQLFFVRTESRMQHAEIIFFHIQLKHWIN
jgi:hypothetical protein